jgi:hypothetical protein
MPVAAPRRRADRDEHRLGACDGRGKIGGEGQTPAARVALDQPVEPGLEDRHLAALQRLDLAGVLVDAGHVVAEVGEAGAGDQAHIARADHRYAHSQSSAA